MSHARMHDDEVDTDADLVHRLLASQYPQWAELPIERVVSAGTDNAIYRLGDELAVRLPRIHWAVESIAKEWRWIPILAPQLPLPVPIPLALGEPHGEFPHQWEVVRWLPGELATLDRLDEPIRAARELAEFVRALQLIDPTGGPQHRRGQPIRAADAMLRQGVEGLRGEVDGDAVLEAWSRVMDAPDHDGPPVWFHGDLAHLNLLARAGRLSAVIDWGTCGVGDPAIDTIVAWNLFTGDAPRRTRDALGTDDATWLRGKGWVLTGVFGIPYYRDTNPVLVANVVHAVDAVLADEE